MTAQAPPSDAAMKQRIIKHMNEDHSSSISDYAQYYSKLPPSLAATAELVDLSLTRLTISTRSSPSATTTTYIPIRPAPMESLGDARKMLVFMANEAMEGLGKSPYVVDFYTPPQTLSQWVPMFLVCLGFYSLSFKSNFDQGAFVREYVLYFTPWLADFCKQYQLILFILLVVVHFVEAIHMVNSRLRKHQTPHLSRVWWLWVCGTFVEGVFSFLRFDQGVAAIKEKKKKEKH